MKWNEIDWKVKVRNLNKLPESLTYYLTSSGSVQWNFAPNSLVYLAPKLLIMASPTNPEVKKNSKAVVSVALRDLPSEQVHTLTDEQYPTVKERNFISAISWRHTTWEHKKHNVMRKSITKVYKCLARANINAKRIASKIFYNKFHKKNTQLGLFQVLQCKINHFSFLQK